MEPFGSYLKLKVLFVCSDLMSSTAAGRAARALIDDLKEEEVAVIETISASDAMATVGSDTAIQCVVLDWNLPEDDNHDGAMAVLREIRKRSNTLPVFLLSDRGSVQEIPVEFIQMADDFIWLLDDTPDFISGRVLAAAERYEQNLLPPMFKALIDFAGVHEYSWHTPGHTGGTAFLKSPIGRAFFSYFGENLLRSDLSISVGELGSLLDHSGPIGKSERYAAEVFGAHRTYYVTNGSSTSNRIILMASVTRGQVTHCDRNCHKSVEHAMTMTGAIPVYLRPSRNRYGIIGPIYPERLAKEAVAASVKENPLVKSDPAPVHAVITNSTYDGLCYNVRRVVELLSPTLDRLHFDEAWYGYARFNPLYKDRFAMYGEANAYPSDAPTVFATQSTHKLLAALSQASMIHIREGRRAIPHSHFNESFMMHASTSPQYAIIASNDVSAAMMEGPGGRALTAESIAEAVAFRQMISRTRSDFAARGEWFFDCWQPREIKGVPFHDADPDALETDPSAWVLHPGEVWHGFNDLEDDFCMLDPIKVSVVTPGVRDEGGLKENGIPAPVVTSYLDRHGIVVEKTGDFTILFLFSIGVTKGKWGALLNALLDFKRDYDANMPLRRAIPALAEDYPANYGGLGLKDLCDNMFASMKELKTTEMMANAFSELPVPVYSPVETYERLVRDEVESVGLKNLENRVAATGVVPYPPGIPLLMPGENAGSSDGPMIGYLKALESFDRRFPGFGHDTHGVEVEDGEYRVLVLK
jgi:arginine/lysine/ornithine decarboxylase